ncbi:MAG: phage major capsid protein [Vicinamibacterales bacterium]
MPGSDVTQWDPLFKDDYGPAIINQLQEENIILGFMESEMPDDTWQGRQKVIPTKIGRNWSVGSIGVGGALPQQNRSAYQDFKVPMRSTYGRVGFERNVIAQSRNKKGSWQQVIPSEMEGLVQDMAFARNRIAWGYGSGILALVNGAQTADTTIEVDAPGNIAGSVMGNRYLFGDATSGMYVAFLDSSNVVQGTATITAVAAAGTSITVDTPITCDDNAKIVIAQTPTQNSYNKEPEGILAGIDDGTYVATYHDLSRSTYPILQSYIAASVGALSLDAVQEPIDALSIRVGKNIDFFACEHAVRRSYLTLLQSDRRYTGADLMAPDGGTKAAKKPTGKQITYGDIPILVDRDAPYRMMFGINKESWTRYTESEFTWADDDGSVLKWVNGFDQWTAFGYILDNFHCQRPNCNFRMEGIDVNQLVVHSF